MERSNNKGYSPLSHFQGKEKQDRKRNETSEGYFLWREETLENKKIKGRGKGRGEIRKEQQEEEEGGREGGREGGSEGGRERKGERGREREEAKEGNEKGKGTYDWHQRRIFRQ